MGFIGQRVNQLIRNYKRKQFINTLHKNNFNPSQPLRSETEVNFSHIGLNGDIIYSIPTMLAIAGTRKINLYLDINQKSMYTSSMKHHNKDKILTRGSVEFIKPLILSNPQFASCEILDGQPVDFDLNAFRNYPFNYNSGHICRWYFHTFGVSRDLSLPWLQTSPDTRYADTILIARSFRYRSPEIDYRFMSQYPNVGFIGLKDEFEDMQQAIPQLEYVAVTNALDMAQKIAGSNLFIGNQSFPFAVAEGLKVKRVLEVFYECPNVIPEGKDAYDFCYQLQFEKIVDTLIRKQAL